MLFAVPNVSEGRDLGLIGEIAGRDLLLDIHSDPDHNRSVLTYAGPPDVLPGVLVAMAGRAVATIDLRTHRGVHPRVGAVDVLPFVPEEPAAREAARTTAGRIAGEIGVPVYLYGAASPSGRPLPSVRTSFESLGERLDPPPDLGPLRLHPTAGATCVGVRPPLVAFNVNLRGSLDAARTVARALRGSDGGPPSVRALAFTLPSRGLVQVSMNLTDPRAVGPKATFDLVLEHAAGAGLEVVEAEVVGLIPDSLLSELRGLPLREPARSVEEALAAR